MEPLLKRPRLSMFANEDPSPELDKARRSNDLLLKSRFEAIFDKYAKDFTDVGDVIDLNTGRIEEDNGHLRRLGNENDTGHSRSTSPKPHKHVANGRSMLRAMTVAPDRDDSFFDDDSADDVIQSIETIAVNAAMSDDDAQANVQSEDDLLDLAPHALLRQQNYDQDTLYTSDPDSLFGVPDADSIDAQGPSRFSSPDSLFEGDTPPSAARQNASYAINAFIGTNHAHTPAQDEFDETAIYAKFGKKVGRDVLELLKKRDDAELHIDPAWRIPAEAKPPQCSTTSSNDSIPDEVITKKYQDTPNKNSSVWAEGTKRKGSRFAARAKALRWRRHESAESAESDDPLQDGFHGGNETESDEDVDLDRCFEVVKNGVCPYCQEQYVNKTGVMQHIHREARFTQNGQDRGEHDEDHMLKLIDYAHEAARLESSGPKGARLAMCDFKTIVELHEGAGMTFLEIIESQTLRTLKSDPDVLEELYSRWRDIENVKGLSGRSKEWTRIENTIIKRLRKNTNVSMDRFRKTLTKRTAVEIGNKLADMWLTELYTGKNKEQEVEDEVELPQPPPSAKRRRAEHEEHELALQNSNTWRIRVKSEEEDEDGD